MYGIVELLLAELLATQGEVGILGQTVAPTGGLKDRANDIIN